MATKKDSRLTRAGVSDIIRVDTKKYAKLCPSCGEEHYFRSMPAAKRAYKLRTLCKACSAKRNIQKFNGTIQEKFGVRTGWLNTFKVGAKGRGLMFEIDEKDIANLMVEQEGRCALSGLPINLPTSSNYRLCNMSIDRIDNSKGYTKDNIQLVFKKLNILRGSLDIEEFVELCKAVAEYN